MENYKPACKCNACTNDEPIQMRPTADGFYKAICPRCGTEYLKAVDKVEVMKQAERIYNYVAPWDRDYETVDDIANDIASDPVLVIEYLMDLLEGM